MSSMGSNCSVFMKTIIGILFIVLCYTTYFVGSRNVDVNFPIIYSKPFQSERNTYFGYSVVLHQEWVQIGAPRANYSTIKLSGVLEPGVVYRCQIFKPCKEVILDRTGNKQLEINKQHIWDNKNNSWIGVAMDLEPGANGRFVVCGHLWKNQVGYQNYLQGLKTNSKTSDDKALGYYTVGKCYWNYANKNITIPAENLWPHNEFVQDKQYHYSQVGMSIHFYNKEKGGVLIGAPGMLDPSINKGRGGVMDFKLSETSETPSVRKRSTLYHKSCRRMFAARRAFVASKCAAEFNINDYDLWGYQVSSGLFDGECLFVASAPRGDKLKGYVLMYDVHDPAGEKCYNTYRNMDPKCLLCQVHRKEKGREVGEYFGSSMTVADITGDGSDELIVGSPLYSTKELGDQGCIYVYNYKYRETTIQTICGTKVSGRFGTTLASLGDLDRDTYEDIAVGVPYEGQGVVYIYNGSPEGLKETQRIVASEMDSSLRGFGISISRPQDFDSNRYADIAIGSYLSEQTVLLRSYPVIDLHLKIDSPTSITDQDTLVNLQVVTLVHYVGEDAANYLEMNYTLIVKSTLHTKNLGYISKNVILERNRQNRTTFEIPISLEEDIKYKDIEVSLFVSPTQQINPTIKNVIRVNNDSEIAVRDGFCKTCHIERESSRSTLRIPIGPSCKTADCRPDLRLYCNFLYSENTTFANAFIIGSSRVIEIVINITNFEATAYAVSTSVELPLGVKIAQIPSFCSVTNMNITCDFDKIIINKYKTINILVEMSAYDMLLELSDAYEPLYFKISSYSKTSEDRNRRDNECTLTQHLIADANVEIQSSGLFQPCDPVPFARSTRDTEAKPTKFSHIFKVHKVGVTPRGVVHATLFIPHKWEGSQIFASVSMKADDDQISCSQRHDTGHVLTEELEKYASSCNLPTSNRTLYINCTNENVECQVYLCKLPNLKENLYPSITVNVEMNTSVLEPQLGENDHILFASHGLVEIEGIKNVLKPELQLQYEVIDFTVFAGSAMEEEVQLWIIIVCVVAGILLLALIIYGLFKAGFFQRKLKDDMQKALKNSDGG